MSPVGERVPTASTVVGAVPHASGSRRWALLLAACGVALMVSISVSALTEAYSVGIEGDRTAAAEGSMSRNVIVGLGEDDAMRGLAGDDLLSGGAGDDGLYGGPGNDVLLAGRGADLVVARDGDKDYVGCGPGTDTAIVDSADRVAPGCEAAHVGY